MLRLLPDMPRHVVAVEAVGHVEADDYKNVLEPAVARALETGEKVRFLYVLGPEFDGLSLGAGWEDTKVAIGHWNSWEKIAVVTDRDLISHAVRALAWMLPGEVRVFSTDARGDATVWVSD